MQIPEFPRYLENGLYPNINGLLATTLGTLEVQARATGATPACCGLAGEL